MIEDNLTIPFEVTVLGVPVVTASRHRGAAIAALAAGEGGEALVHASEAVALQRRDEDGELVFLARLVGG